MRALALILALFAPRDVPAPDKAFMEALKFLTTVRGKEQAGVASLLDRWFPDRPELAPFLAEGGEVGKTGRKFLVKQAAALAEFAGRELSAGHGYRAGLEAFRALGLDPDCRKAAEVLLYDDGVHPRAKKLKSDGLAPTDWGWIPEKVAKAGKAGLVPENGAWVAEADGDAAHAAWANARTLDYTFVRLKTNLPAREAAEVGKRLDFLVAWIRARFCRIEGFAEPAWPIDVRVPAGTPDYEAEVKTATGGPVSTPFGICFYPRPPFVVINAETCRKSFETTAGIAQHETAHAFLRLAFSGPPPAAEPNYGWMAEAYAAYCYYVSPERPVNGDFSRMLVKKFGSPGDPRRAEVERVARGEDVFGELNRLGYGDSSGHMQAYVAGAMLANYAEETDGVREEFARFVAACSAWKAEKGLFDRLLGPTAALHAKIAEWWKRKPQ